MSLLGGREHLRDDEWFALYGAGVAAAVASLENRELVAEFSRLVAPLEKRAGRPLGEPGRTRAFRAFYECPDGFRRCAADAERRGSRNACGLLLTMLAADEYRLPESEKAT